jgi:hypothetical protein
MKNTALKYYIAAFYLCSTFVLFAQPGDTAPGGLETDNDTTPGAPIDNYVWVLAVIGLLFVFMKFRAIQNKKMHS